MTEWRHCKGCTSSPWPTFSRSNILIVKISEKVRASAKMRDTALYRFWYLPWNIAKVVLRRLDLFSMSNISNIWNGESRRKYVKYDFYGFRYVLCDRYFQGQNVWNRNEVVEFLQICLYLYDTRRRAALVVNYSSHLCVYMWPFFLNCVRACLFGSMLRRLNDVRNRSPIAVRNERLFIALPCSIGSVEFWTPDVNGHFRALLNYNIDFVPIISWKATCERRYCVLNPSSCYCHKHLSRMWVIVSRVSSFNRYKR